MPQNTTTEKIIQITEESAGMRLDQALSAGMTDHSRTRIKRWIEDGHVSINGKIIKKTSYKLSNKDLIRAQTPPLEPLDLAAEHIPLNIIYEDEDILVIDKPIGLVTHPAPGHWTGTLVNAVLHHCSESLKGIGDVKRPGIVHRLDKDTSGVMIIAKSQIAHNSLTNQFKDHGKTGALKREYLCFVWGTPRPAAGTIDAAIGRDGTNRTKMSVTNGQNTRHARSHFQTLKTFAHPHHPTATISLIRVALETGRTHQVRVHMSHIGHPLLGDPLYGAHMKSKANLWENTPVGKIFKNLPAQALHAAHLTISHPASDEVLSYNAPLPPHLKDFLHTLENL